MNTILGVNPIIFTHSDGYVEPNTILALYITINIFLLLFFIIGVIQYYVRYKNLKFDLFDDLHFLSISFIIVNGFAALVYVTFLIEKLLS